MDILLLAAWRGLTAQEQDDIKLSLDYGSKLAVLTPQEPNA